MNRHQRARYNIQIRVRDPSDYLRTTSLGSVSYRQECVFMASSTTILIKNKEEEEGVERRVYRYRTVNNSLRRSRTSSTPKTTNLQSLPNRTRISAKNYSFQRPLPTQIVKKRFKFEDRRGSYSSLGSSGFNISPISGEKEEIWKIEQEPALE